MMNWEELLRAVEVLKHYCQSFNSASCTNGDCIFTYDGVCLLSNVIAEDWDMEVIENNLQNLLNM